MANMTWQYNSLTAQSVHMGRVDDYRVRLQGGGDMTLQDVVNGTFSADVKANILKWYGYPDINAVPLSPLAKTYRDLSATIAKSHIDLLTQKKGMEQTSRSLHIALSASDVEKQALAVKCTAAEERNQKLEESNRLQVAELANKLDSIAGLLKQTLTEKESTQADLEKERTTTMAQEIKIASQQQIIKELEEKLAACTKEKSLELQQLKASYDEKRKNYKEQIKLLMTTNANISTLAAQNLFSEESIDLV